MNKLIIKLVVVVAGVSRDSSYASKLENVKNNIDQNKL